MAGTEFDVIIGGTKARVVRGGERPGYRARTVRQEVQQQLISQTDNPKLATRTDSAKMYQTNWSAGAQWWKPILGSAVDSYYRGNHLDVWSEPGKVVPLNNVSEGDDSTGEDVRTKSGLLVAKNGTVYTIGNTTDVDATYQDVLIWGGTSWSAAATYSSGIDGTHDSHVYDHTDDYFYLNEKDSVKIHRFSPANTAEDHDWATIPGGYVCEYASSIFMQPNQGLMVYNGRSLHTISKTGPTVTEVYYDGMGYDLLKDRSVGAQHPVAMNKVQLAVPSPEGVYYVKNVADGYESMAYVFRVNKNASGSWIGEPIATLPRGTIVLDIIYHLGSIIISATPSDAKNLYGNSSTQVEVIFYQIDSQSGISVLGSPLGGRDEADETPYKFLMAHGHLLYISGQKRLWVYDASRGGMHVVLEYPTELGFGGVVDMVPTTDGTNSAFLLLGHTTSTRANWFYYAQHLVDDPDIVTNFGDDETFYTLDSNFFDFNLPFEIKEPTKVEIWRQAGDGDQEWTVQLSADGGAFSDILTHSTNGETYGSATISGTTGRRFQYRLIYQTKDINRTALEGLMITAATGDMVNEWELILDGSELLNVDNEVQDEETFHDALRSIAGTATQVDFVDNMQEQGQETDTATSVKVKVQAVEITKTKPGESVIQVILREA